MPDGDPVKRLESEVETLRYQLENERRLREEAEASAARAVSRCAVLESDAWEKAESIARRHPTRFGNEIAELIRERALVQR